MRPMLKEIAELCERLRNHSADAPEISRQSIDVDAAAGVIVRQHEDIDRLEERVRVLEGALKGLFARLDHPGNGGQHVNYFLRWPEVEAARAALSAGVAA